MNKLFLFRCPKCSFSSDSKPKVKLHLKTHVGGVTYNCDFCDFVTSTLRSLKKHITQVHTAGKKKEEDIIVEEVKKPPRPRGRPRKIIAPPLLALDEPRAGGEENQENRRTEVVPVPKEKLKRGPKKGIEKTVKIYQCSLCPYHSERAWCVRKHERVHTGEKPYSCRYCEFTSSALYSRNCHERVWHLTQKRSVNKAARKRVYRVKRELGASLEAYNKVAFGNQEAAESIEDLKISRKNKRKLTPAAHMEVHPSSSKKIAVVAPRKGYRKSMKSPSQLRYPESLLTGSTAPEDSSDSESYDPEAAAPLLNPRKLEPPTQSESTLISYSALLKRPLCLLQPRTDVKIPLVFQSKIQLGRGRPRRVLTMAELKPRPQAMTSTPEESVYHQPRSRKPVTPETKNNAEDQASPSSSNNNKPLKIYRHVFKCETCPYKTNNAHEIRAHVKVHDEPELFPCTSCSFTTDSDKKLATHAKMHKTYISSLRRRRALYNTTSRPRLPKLKQKKQLPTKRDTTTATAKITKKYSRIAQEKSGNKELFSCSHCDYTSFSRQCMTQHQPVHSNVRPFPCRFCRYKSKRKFDLQKHEIRFHTR